MYYCRVSLPSSHHLHVLQEPSKVILQLSTCICRLRDGESVPLCMSIRWLGQCPSWMQICSPTVWLRIINEPMITSCRHPGDTSYKFFIGHFVVHDGRRLSYSRSKRPSPIAQNSIWYCMGASNPVIEWDYVAQETSFGSYEFWERCGARINRS